MRHSANLDQLKARLALEEPNLHQSEELASLLRTLRFHVESVSPRGIHFTGPSSLFETVFQSRVRSTPRGFTFEHEPQLPESIAKAGVSVYLPTKPEFFT